MEINYYELEPIPREIKTYDLQDEVYLLTKIGNGQIGGDKVSCNGTILVKGSLIEPAFLGLAEDLKDCKIDIETNVLDVNTFTNACVITTTFLNQNNEVLFTKIDKGDAPENGVASFKGTYLLKILTLLFLIFNVFISEGYSQAADNTIEFENLETPSSPGFILLDETPSSIEKPVTPQGLGLSLLGFQKNGGALEFAPFWLINHPNMTAKKMNENKFPILTHFSISLAAVKSDSVGYVAGGIRTRVFQSYGSKISEKLNELEKQIVIELSESPEDLDLEKIEKLRRDYVDLTSKPIVNIDFAAAIGGGSATNSFDDIALSRWAAWLSLNWRPQANNFYLTTLVRYINNEKYEDQLLEADLMDVGTRLNYDISNFSLSLEYLQRLNFTTDDFDGYRLAVIGSYKLSDAIYLTTTFGKNFSEVNNIIALAGVNFGFSKNKIKAF